MNLLSHLPFAGGDDRALGLMKIEALWVPRQLDEFHHLSGPAFLIFDQRLIGNLQQRRGRQHGTPVIHDAHILTVIMRQVAQIVGIGPHAEEILEVDRQAGVERMALHVDDAGLGKCAVNQSCVQEIAGHLVDHPQRASAGHREALEIRDGHAR